MRKCNCSGNCYPQNNDISRRQFLGLVGTGVAMSLVGPSAWGAFELPSDELERWKRSLTTSGARVYTSDVHTDARMHLGGIGTGNFEIGADGQFTTWQLFNTLRDGDVPFYFGVKAGRVAKLLQTTGGPEWPRVKQIEMTGEYPMATLRFRDDDLPVQVELTAFSPMEPLDVDLSSMPLAIFRFRLKNATSEPQSVSLAAMMTNPVGYDAKGDIEGIRHPNFGGNINEVFQDGQMAGLFMRAKAGDPALDRPVSIYTMANLSGLMATPDDRPKNLKVRILKRQSLPKNGAIPEETILWLEDAGIDISERFLRAAGEFVQSGGTLVFSGATMPLLQEYAAVTDGRSLEEAVMRPDIVFEDFENGYENWQIQGTAFGREPQHGTLPNQWPVTGFLGKGLVNSYVYGDNATGKLTSKTFTIERRFIRFLVGGGHYPDTAVQLVVGGVVCRATSGKDNERLEPAFWDVREFAGQSAHIEIVDNERGPWGHINVDQIVFSDHPANDAVMSLLDELLPARFSGLHSLPASSSESVKISLDNQTLKPGSEQASAKNGLQLLVGHTGKGKVVLACGPILDPSLAEMVPQRQMAYATLCELIGAQYLPIDGQSPKSPGFGTLALATTGSDVTAMGQFEDWSEVWREFSENGCFRPTGRAGALPCQSTSAGHTINGAIASTVSVPAGGMVEVPFFFAWHYPNSYYKENGEWIGCHYATRWTDARAVIAAAAGQQTLVERTERYRTTLYDSTLPHWLLDCLTANSGILRHIGVVFRIENGDIYGWEGSNGCCDPTCTHVWGYEQSLARLFPSLERDMRRIDFKHQQGPDGGINNRTAVPSPPNPSGEHPFADGHASCILKAYREALNCSDDSFFKEYWPNVKLAVEYLINRDAASNGGNPRGVLADDQWNTYDEALHGVSPFISGYYLAALRAGEEWGRRMGDSATADRYREIFQSGQEKLIELCWNGEYFQQYLPDYLSRPGEVGPGCMADQLLGQWWAHQLGLGYILLKDKVHSALRSIFKYNWKSDLTGWRFAPRAFAGPQDKGLIICTWPRGGRPANVMNYSDEVWTGIEYQVAAHMIYEGFLEPGFSIAKGARDRYDGVPRSPIARNPWCEIECGGHYARAMSSWSLLLALSGWKYDGPRGELRFMPLYQPDNFKSLFTGPEGWGSVAQTWDGTRQRVQISVASGALSLETLEIASVQKGNYHPTVTLAGEKVPVTFTVDGDYYRLNFGKRIAVTTDQTLEILLG